MAFNERQILDGLQQFSCLLQLAQNLPGQRGLGWVAADHSLIPEGHQGRKTEPALKRELQSRQAFAPGRAKRYTDGPQIGMISHVTSSSQLRHAGWMGTWGTLAGRSVSASLFRASMPHDGRDKPLSQALWRPSPEPHDVEASNHLQYERVRPRQSITVQPLVCGILSSSFR